VRIENSKLWWYVTNNYHLEYRRVLIDLLDTQPGAEYIDMGCGDGELTSKCATKIFTQNISGTDLVLEKLIEADAHRNIKIYNRELGKPMDYLESNSFDVITANQVIEHLDDTDTFLKECYRILKPGGYLIISTTNLSSWHWIVLLILGLQPPGACISDEMQTREFNNYTEERLHRRLFTFRGLERVLKYFGFKIENSVGTYWMLVPLSIGRVLCKLDKHHSSCITIKARKLNV
jgi:2-polyprenyl-3-methyl-5-hydroxy-6-metoxy-1,4-benzoquinol methylase